MSDAVQMEKTYDPGRVEKSIYATWRKHECFAATPDDRPRDQRFTIVIPPPNVTGALHLGHALNNTLQDILVRWHRMRGHNTLWLPGTDHAGIATQAVVEKRLKQDEGKSRHDLGRDALVQRIWDWKDQYEKRILSQLELMGCSCDWSRTRFTLDDGLARAVRHTFFKLFKGRADLSRQTAGELGYPASDRGGRRRGLSRNGQGQLLAFSLCGERSPAG
jgi:valyl-tRNA synthetase